MAALALALASLLFPVLFHRIPRILLPLAFGLLGVGLLMIGLIAQLPLVIVGAVVANIGAGFLLSTLQTWIVQGLPFEQRGRASGASTASLFIGQFLAPLIVFALAEGIGLGPAIAVIGVVGVVGAILGGVLGRSVGSAS